MKGGKRENAGRPMGVPNKTTEQLRETFSQLLSNNLNTLQSDIEKLDPKDRIKAIIDIAKFVLPTLKTVELQNSPDNFQPFEVVIWRETKTYENKD